MNDHMTKEQGQEIIALLKSIDAYVQMSRTDTSWVRANTESLGAKFDSLTALLRKVIARS